MERFKLKRLDRIGSSLGCSGYEVATLYTPDRDMIDVIRCAPISAEAIDLVREALTKLKRIELSNFEFVGEIEGILREYDKLTTDQ